MVITDHPVGGVIRKNPHEWRVRPNLVDYDAGRASFTWEEAARALDSLPGGRGLNIAYECVDRHAGGSLADRVALRCLGRRGTERSITYASLREETNRFAHVLHGLGVEAGDRVFVLLGRVPELHVSVLGTLKHRAVACSLFSAPGADFREALEIDSMDFLILVDELHERTGVEIPERDYPQLASIEGCVAYLAARRAALAP